MKNLKSFKNCCLENNKVNEKGMSQEFADVFNKFIKGQVVKEIAEVPYKSGEFTAAHGEGLEFENGYKYISYGGGCSGYDCNTCYIVDPEGKTIASYDWDGI